MNKNIVKFLSQNDLINQSQHGFLQGRSTDTILLKFYDYVTDCMDRNLVVDAVFLDFSKAFESVPHDILIARLKSCGIGGNVADWIEDFLSDRYQRFRVGSVL